MDGGAGLDRTGSVGDEERVPTEAGIPLAAVGIEDPERGVAARRAGPISGDDDLRGLADHVPPEADPGPPGELQADPRPLPDRGGHGRNEPGWLQDEEGDPRPTGQGRQPAQALGEPARPLRPGWQVHDEEVHGPAGQERASDGEALFRARGREHDQPFRLDAAGHGLHRVERRREVQPGHDGAARLRLRGEPEGERGPPAREVPLEREAHAAGQPAGPQDGVQLREPGGDDAGRVGGRAGKWDPGSDARVRIRPDGRCRRRCRRHREGAHHLPNGARRGRSPARSKGRKGRRHVRGKGRHQASSIEHPFE
jgi:hypothetical protein